MYKTLVKLLGIKMVKSFKTKLFFSKEDSFILFSKCEQGIQCLVLLRYYIFTGILDERGLVALLL